MNTSSSVKIRRPGDKRRVRLGCLTAEFSAASLTAVFSEASLSAGLSITGGHSLPVCRGRAPCMGSVGSSQSSRCVFSKVCSSRISKSGLSETSLFLSCEGIVISSSSVGSQTRRSRPRATSLRQSLVVTCFSITEKIVLHSVLPLDPPKLNPGHGHQNVADLSRGGIRRDDYWLQFNDLFNYTEDTAPTQPQSVGGNYSPEIALKPRLDIHHNYSYTVSHVQPPISTADSS